MLQHQPSPRRWDVLNTWIMANMEILDDPNIMEYIEHSLQRWPDHLRVVPDPWLGMLFVGYQSPYYRLCRALALHHLTCPEDERRQRNIWSHPALDMANEHAWLSEMFVDGPHSGYLSFLWSNEQLKHMTVLDLSYNEEKFGMWWHHWKAVDMKAESLHEDHIAEMVQSPHLSNIRTLKLHHVHIAAPHADALTSNGWHKQIKNLKLGNNFLNIETLTALFDSTWSSLEHLDVLGQAFGLQGMHMLLCQANLPNVLHISLQNLTQQAHQKAYKTRQWTIHHPKLTHLTISNSNAQITTAPLLLATMPETLRNFTSRRMAWTPEQVEMLCKTPWYSQLDLLDLSFNAETLPGQRALEIFSAQGRPQTLRLSDLPTNTPHVEVPTPPPADIKTPEDGSAWWAWQYDATHFAGRPIWNWRPDDTPWRPYSERDDEQIRRRPDGHVPRVRLFKGSPPGPQIRHAPAPFDGMLAFGTSQFPEQICQAFIERYGPKHHKTLKMLTWHDVSDEEEQPSWLTSSSVTELLHTFGNLEFFGVKGGNHLRFEGLAHHNLRALTIITGGMPIQIIRDLEEAHLPNLEVLELWFGIEYYGLTTKPEDLLTLFSNQRPDGQTRFPKLKQLGLCNTLMTNELLEHLIDAPLLTQLETLDLRYGVANDATMAQLLKTPAISNLKRLLLGRNSLSDRDLVDQLSFKGVSVDWGDWQNWPSDDIDVYIEVSE